ncbi:transketolase-like TK C-terminal-containing protein [Mesomycoplasma neurolyticum]|uniref:Transketolase n=1 Tax=Mesomycoplasma neurolyticum TaxID=2120 RepID=A0A449A531_9BACT|nr:transketolase [Mesomycoplasma neurolyticum]VEU59355.1 Transketolase [Mesomycoplasma neurolyticum]
MLKNKEIKFINASRALALDAINKAEQGHIGMALGANETFYSIIKTMKFSEQAPKWIDRDRFVLSAGHGSMALYSLYHFMGLLTIEDIKNHKQFNSKTPSHPEIEKLNFIDASTGPLGQGVAMAVGMAYSHKFLSQKFNQKDLKIINHHIYTLCGDGDFQEGVALEAIQFAGSNNLDRLILIHDYNNVQIDSKAFEVNKINFELYFKAHNFKTIILKNNKPENIIKAIKKAKSTKKAVYIQVPSHIAYKTKHQDLSSGHHGFLNHEETIEYKKSLEINNLRPFEYEKEYYKFGEKMLKQKNIFYTKWQKKLVNYKEKYSLLYDKLQKLLNDEITFDLSNLKFSLTNKATRDYALEISKFLQKNSEFLLGGSADLRAATKIGFDDEKNIKYGIREFAMVAINNGIYLHSKIKTIAATFLVFSDYAKSALRLAALMKIPNIFVFSHDSYSVGGDGPTHQPVEQLTMLRSIPDFEVLRVADETELKHAFDYALNNKNNPVAIILCRQPLKSFNLQSKYTSSYFIKQNNDFDLTILSSGSEVELAYNISLELEKHNIRANVVSVINLKELLENISLIEKLKIKEKPIFAIEASNDTMWYKFALYNKFSGQFAKNFGHSAPGDFVYKYNGFEKQKIKEKILDFLNKK